MPAKMRRLTVANLRNSSLLRVIGVLNRTILIVASARHRLIHRSPKRDTMIAQVSHSNELLRRLSSAIEVDAPGAKTQRFRQG